MGRGPGVGFLYMYSILNISRIVSRLIDIYPSVSLFHCYASACMIPLKQIHFAEYSILDGNLIVDMLLLQVKCRFHHSSFRTNDSYIAFCPRHPCPSPSNSTTSATCPWALIASAIIRAWATGTIISVVP